MENLIQADTYFSKNWMEILIATYNELCKLGASDVLVFGSQAMSMHLKKTMVLASKDIDLLATGVSTRMVNRLCGVLTKYSAGGPPNYQLQNSTCDDRRYPTFSISLRARDEKPFMIELFQTYLGHDVRRLTPYATFVTRWENEFQTLNIEAVICTRLAFRPPERISSFNAHRLNAFIKSVLDRIDWKIVEKFAKDFRLEQRIAENLKDLRRRKLSIIGSENLSSVS